MMEFSTGGSSGGGDPMEGGSDSHRRKKRYHRHTAYQIQRLEGMFKECPHPDEKTRNLLSRELGLHPRQIKFWFQNRRTQMKAQHERADNNALRMENDKIRCENIAIREALKNVICPTCGGPPVTEDSYFDEQKLRIDNMHLKEELDRVSSIAAKYIGRPISQLPPVQPIHVSSLDLSMASFAPQVMHHGPSLDFDLLSGSSSSLMPNSAFPNMSISEMDKSVMVDIATDAMAEAVKLLQTEEPLWIKSNDGRYVLNLGRYETVFPSRGGQLRNPNVRIEASKASGVVIMNSLSLVDMFMDPNKWVEFFPTVVSRARTVDVISGVRGTHSGSAHLMYGEMQFLSALVPTRQSYFLRLCQQVERSTWIIVDGACDIPHQESQFSSSCKAFKLPSGCLIREMPNGYSEVTWVEHWEVEDRAPINRLYGDLIRSGLPFGAERWLSTLQRMCERYACLMVSGSSTRELGGVIPSPEGKRSMMKLAQRMVNILCSCINPPSGQQWTTLPGTNEYEVQATLRKNVDPGQPNGVILSAAATIWLPIAPEKVFNFFKDERTRTQWDVLSNQNPVQEVANISNGSNSGNGISILRAFNTSQNNILILQESCVDSSGSIVVYCPVELPGMNIAMSGEDTSYIPLLPSGFTITSDGRQNHLQPGLGNGDGASTSGTSSGSLVTVVFQILVSNLPTARMSPESVNTVNNLIGTSIQQIKAALTSTTS